MKAIRERIEGFRAGRLVLGTPRGASAMEYIIILTLVSLMLIGILEAFAGGVRHQFDTFIHVLQSDVSRDGDGVEGHPQNRQTAQRDSGPTASADGTTAAGSQRVTPQEGDGQPRQPMAEAEREPAAGSVGGINPLVIFIGLILLGLLFYVIFGKKNS